MRDLTRGEYKCAATAAPFGIDRREMCEWELLPRQISTFIFYNFWRKSAPSTFE